MSKPSLTDEEINELLEWDDSDGSEYGEDGTDNWEVDEGVDEVYVDVEGDEDDPTPRPSEKGTSRSTSPPPPPSSPAATPEASPSSTDMVTLCTTQEEAAEAEIHDLATPLSTLTQPATLSRSPDLLSCVNTAAYPTTTVSTTTTPLLPPAIITTRSRTLFQPSTPLPSTSTPADDQPTPATPATPHRPKRGRVFSPLPSTSRGLLDDDDEDVDDPQPLPSAELLPSTAVRSSKRRRGPQNPVVGQPLRSVGSTLRGRDKRKTVWRPDSKSNLTRLQVTYDTPGKTSDVFDGLENIDEYFHQFIDDYMLAMVTLHTNDRVANVMRGAVRRLGIPRLSISLRSLIRNTFNVPPEERPATQQKKTEKRQRCFLCPTREQGRTRVCCSGCGKSVCASHYSVFCPSCC